MSTRLLMGSRGKGASLSWMVLLSSCIHLLLFTVILSLPSLPPPKLTLGPVYSVALVSAPPGFLSPPPESSLAPEIMKSEAERHAVVLKKATAASPAVPMRRVDVMKQSTAAEAAVEGVRRKMAALPPAVPLPRVPAEATPPQSAGMTEVERQMRSRRYVATISSLVWRQWAFPREIPLPAGSEAVVHVTVLANGTVAEMGFEKRSGNQYFDESALKAIRKAAPLPPFPEGLGGGRLEIGIRFHPSRLR